MRPTTLVLLTLLANAVVAPLAIADDAGITRAVTEVIETQQRAWNAGDIAGYMAHYWKSEQLTFSSEGKTTRGWDQTRARYDERYATREQMGRLTRRLDGRWVIVHDHTSSDPAE